MTTPKSFGLILVSTCLLLTGAGCGQGQTAISPERMNEETALSDSFAPANPAAVQPPPAAAVKPAAAPASTETPAETPAAAKTWPRPTSFPGVLPAAEITGKIVKIATDKGDIVFELLGQEGPKAASNFVALARSGFYDGLTFHRVEPGFVIQGGDPLGNGRGGPGYDFADDPVRLNYQAGIVAMANSGPDTNGSQFFIVLEDQPTLGKNYSIFGRVVSGLKVAQSIKVGDVMRSVTVADKKK